ncbi:MAG: Calx-beta domain-containing protein, partial [Nitrospirota bacterium]
INWTASKGQAWVSLSSTGGTLGAGANTTVTVSINSNANTLTPGTYNDTVSFTNTTNGNGNTIRPVSLTVNALPGVLSVSPSDGLSSSGNQGGPFSPSSKNYTLQNTGGSSINWTASKGQAWVSLSSTGGTLGAGANTTVTVSINSNANTLTPSTYNDTVSFTNTTNGNGNTTRAVSLTVEPLPTVTIAATDPNATEPSDPGTFTVSHTGSTSLALTVYYSTSGTATAGSDYNSLSGSVTIGAGSTSANITVTPIDDSLVESDETVIVTLSSNPAYIVGSPSSATVTIISDDVAPAGTLQFSSATYSVNENGGSAVITVTRTGGSNGAVSVNYATANGTAIAGSDYTSASNTLSWANGDTSNKTFTVSIMNDSIDETNETFTVTLSSPTGGATLGSPSTATVTILDNDTAGITVTPTSGLVTTEAGGTASFTIVLNTQPMANVTIGLSSSDTTEGTVSPASVTFTTANWNNPQTVTVTGVDDAVVDGNIAYTIVTAAATSTDTTYNGMNASDVSVTNYDNDSLPTVLYVEPYGLCGGNSPCYSRIQDAINAAGDGATIKVAQGTYYENIIVYTSKEFTLQGGWNSSFTSKAEDPSLTIIDGDVTGDGIGDGSVIRISAGAGVEDIITIEGFTIKNGWSEYGGGVYAYAISSGSISFTLNSNIISNNNVTNYGGGIGAFSQNLDSNTSVTLANNIIVDNNSDVNGGGIYAYSEDSGNTAVTLINNTIADNSAINNGGGLRAYSYNASITDLTLKNNIIWGNQASNGGDIAITQYGGTTTVNSSYNDVRSIYNDPGTYNDLGNNINADPLFVDPASGDYHLIGGSPCIDTGTNTGAPLTDFEGDPRPFDGDGDTVAITDIGSDEYVGAPSFTLTVNGSGTGSGMVRDQDTGSTKINCTITNGSTSGDCTESYEDGTSVTLSATTDQGSTFSGWSGGGCSGRGTCTVTMSDDITVTAEFNRETGITVTIPNGGEEWEANTTQTIRWNYSGNPCYGVKIELLKNDVLNRTIAYYASIGRNGSGSYNWRIPSNQAEGNDYRVKIICTTNSSVTDTSDGDFIIEGPPPPEINITRPVGGETWVAGNTEAITWTTEGAVGSYVKIELLKGGAVASTLTSYARTSTGSYNWRIPTNQSSGTDYQIRVSDRTNSGVNSTSGYFTIEGPPPPEINITRYRNYR